MIRSVFLLLSLLPVLVNAEVLATVNGEAIELQDLREFSRKSPLFTGYMAAPGGPMYLLQLMVDQRLLVLEGERLQMAKPSAEDGGDIAFAMQVEKALLKPCAPISEEQAKAFYEANPMLFSTPYFLRLRRIGLKKDANNVAAKIQQLEAIKQRLLAGEIDFATTADELSEDKEGKGRGGNIGFVPIPEDDHAFWQQLKAAKPEDIIGPLEEKEIVTIYQVTGRHEPIVEPYATAQQQVPQVQQRVCNKAAKDTLILELSKRWPVDIKVDDLSVWPE